MSAESVPPQMNCLIPHLVCSPAAEAIEFYKKAFGAVEVMRMAMPGDARLMHAEIQIDGHRIFLADDFPESCGGKSLSPQALGGTCVTLHRYVPDCDAAVKKAEAAGATVKMPPQDMFWGDRYAALEDPFGHSWSLATHIRDMSPEEMQKGMIEACGGEAPGT